MAFNSGIGTYVRNIVSLLKDGPFKMKLIANAEIIKKWPALASFDLISTSAPLYSIQEQIQFPFLIPSCDLFWTPHYNIPLFPIRAKKRVTTIHDVYHLAYGKTLSLPKRLYAKAVIKVAATISDHIITDSTFSKEEIIKYTTTPREKITVISLGVDLSPSL
ncbi:MAG TPA: glycosyltransferase, partial [Rhabdochlamydiaceae bacterium]|nr:glycosyltransferase [Rhabdochlamydiaceae bacterium]